MAKKFLVPIDLNQLELQNAALQSLATAPSNPVAGQVYFNTTTNKAMVYNGTTWVPWEADTNTVTGVKGNSESTYRTGNVNITAANVGAAASSHTHGNITNAGALQTNDVTIANGDKLVITDASDSNKVARASAAFDGSTATQALTKKGTFETFNNYSHPTYTAASAAAIKVGRDSTGHVITGSALTKSDVGLGNVTDGAEVNQNAFSIVQVNNSSDTSLGTIAADGKTDTLTIRAGSNVTLTANATNKKLTIAATNTTYSAGSQAQLEAGTDTANRVWQAKILHDYVAAKIAEIPADQFLDLNNTTFVANFQWSSTLYPGSTNPNLDGKPVLVLALTDGTSDVYSFLDVEELFNTYTGTAPITVTGQTISHANSGVTAGSKGDTSAQTPTWGSTFKALSGTVNATGHLTAFAEHTVKIPDSNFTGASSSAAGAKGLVPAPPQYSGDNGRFTYLSAKGDWCLLEPVVYDVLGTLYVGLKQGNTSNGVPLPNATTSTAGLMSADDKSKLDGATAKYTITIAAGSTSTVSEIPFSSIISYTAKMDGESVIIDMAQDGNSNMAKFSIAAAQSSTIAITIVA